VEEDGMPSVEERLASLEGRVNEQSQMFATMRDLLAALERRIDRFEQRVEARFDAIDRRFEALEDKLSRNLLWTVGIHVTVLVVVMGAVVTALTR
jgi:uncharacterized coiled-coil protein SlyX